MSMGYIHVRFIKDECFQDYKTPSMLLGMCWCDWKCFKDEGKNLCQNIGLTESKILCLDIDEVVQRYLNNPITGAVVFGGLEPLFQFNEVLEFIECLRRFSDDDVVIYTGYYPHEITDKIRILSKYHNVYLKCGRFIPNSNKKFDEILGVVLNSDNQFGMRITPEFITPTKED